MNLCTLLSFYSVRITSIVFDPAGILATCGALGMAFRRMHQRNSEGYQRWLRARVVAQGFTVIAIIVAGAGQWVKKTDDQGTVTRPSSEKETRAFESRLRAAEEAHAAETMLRAGTVVEPTTPPEPNTLNQNSSSSPPPPKSSWSSWFGISSRR